MKLLRKNELTLICLINTIEGQRILIYDSDLVLMAACGKTFPESSVLQLMSYLNNSLCCYCKQGSITIFDMATFEVKSESSIFNLSSEDSKAALLIKAKDLVLFTLQSHRVDLHSM